MQTETDMRTCKDCGQSIEQGHAYSRTAGGFYHLRCPRPDRATGKHGWPLAPSTAFPDELTLACPECHSTKVMLTVRYAVRGTGPGGRGRLGDPGAVDIVVCQDCGFQTEEVYGKVYANRRLH